MTRDARPAARLSRGESAAAELIAIAEAAAPGDRLGSKEELRARSAVSVGTFNEALRIAQSRGVVLGRPGPGGGGTTGGGATRLRDALDALLIEGALWHASPADIAEMREILAEMAAAADRLDGNRFLGANWSRKARIAPRD